MHMPTITVAAGAALIAVGVGVGLISEPAAADASFMAKYSKYIPAVFGAVLALCGLAAFKHDIRKHAIHVAMVFALLGVIAGGARIPQTIMKDDGSLALISQLGLLLISAGYLAIGIKSFIQARRARKQVRAAAA
jgi:hypothetical protein